MSSNIHVQRICEYCKKEFTARTTKTKYCSHKCNSRHYKEKTKGVKISKSNEETTQKITLEVEKLNMLEFLTVKEVSVLLNCSTKIVYRNIMNGNIKAINFGERVLRIKRSDIDNIFNMY
jgi:excisionase family DNA binding protein